MICEICGGRMQYKCYSLRLGAEELAVFECEKCHNTIQAKLMWGKVMEVLRREVL